MAEAVKTSNKERLIDTLAEDRETLRDVVKRRFRKHTLGKIGLGILAVLYFMALFADILSPYTMAWTNKAKSYHPPSKVYFTYKDAAGKKRLRLWAYEQYNVNVALKKYGVIPPYSMRIISLGTAPGRPELRVVSTQKARGARQSELLRATASFFQIAPGEAAYKELKRAVSEVEAAPDPDERRHLILGEREYDGHTVPMEVIIAKGNRNFLSFFHKGVPYRFLNLFNAQTHFFGSETGGFFMWGADRLGRDMVSRLLHGSRVSLTVGLVGAAISLVIGMIMGGLAGYFGGLTDTLIMRFSEIMYSIPSLYLLFALRSALPSGMPSTQVYLLIVAILSFIGWASLSRVIRGQVLSLKNKDFVMSARTMGLSHRKIIFRHILPNTMSFTIINTTLSIPGYILGESALSLLGLGITEPQSSWGNMLSVARNYRVVQDFPWILTPGIAIFVAIMAWNFFGDGIRDALDPKSKH